MMMESCLRPSTGWSGACVINKQGHSEATHGYDWRAGVHRLPASSSSSNGWTCWTRHIVQDGCTLRCRHWYANLSARDGSFDTEDARSSTKGLGDDMTWWCEMTWWCYSSWDEFRPRNIIEGSCMLARLSWIQYFQRRDKCCLWQIQMCGVLCYLVEQILSSFCHADCYFLWVTGHEVKPSAEIGVLILQSSTAGSFPFF